MKAARLSRRAEGFTLLELLCVIAVIGVLASLLLPALNRGKMRAKRIGCLNNLRQLGVAFQSFAHDHNGQFPMAVPASAGGSEEFTETSYRVAGEFFFSFRHFQTLSNDLVTPKLLACPADTRLPAANFGVLSNNNVSYFVGLKASFSQPYSVLAGDRNLTNDYPVLPSLVRPRIERGWRWSYELHQFNGNLLFADGHVEEKGNKNLAAIFDQAQVSADLSLPSLPVSGAQASSPLTVAPSDSIAAGIRASGYPGQSNLPGPTQPAQQDAAQPGQVVSITSPRYLAQAPPPGAAPSALTNLSPQTSTALLTNGPAREPGSNDEPGFSFFPTDLGTPVVSWVKQSLWLLYLLALLVAAVAFYLRIRLSSSKRRTGEPDR